MKVSSDACTVGRGRVSETSTVAVVVLCQLYASVNALHTLCMQAMMGREGRGGRMSALQTSRKREEYRESGPLWDGKMAGEGAWVLE